MHHLSIRVAWHDNRWNGAVCEAPSKNPFCVALDRIRAERDDAFEERLAGRDWSTLSQDELPPCKAESGGFMNDQEWVRVFEHPYRDNKKAAATHGHLKPTPVTVPAYSTFAVPFAWMLRQNQKDIEAKTPEGLPSDEEPP